MLKIGITGGIGSGKTTVCQIFETLGIPVYYADDRAKRLMTEDPILKRQIVELFGQEAYQKDGSLNRKHIADIVFNNKAQLARLNTAVHPAVGRDANAWHDAQNAPYTLREAALLFEAGSFRQMDKVITVTAPEEVRIARVMKRDQTTDEAVRARMDKQMPEAEKVERADFVIHNDGKHSLISQVLDIHRQLKAL